MTITRDFRDLPGPRRLPLLGNIHQIDASQLHLSLERWAERYGPYYRLRFSGRDLLVVSEPKGIVAALRDRPDAIRRSSRSSLALVELGVAGVFTAEGEDWRKQRKLVMRGFTPEVIQHFFPTLVRMTERMMRRWEHTSACSKQVNMLRDLKAFTLDVAVGLAMGQDINTVENEHNPLQRDAERIFKKVARRLTKPFPYWRYVKLRDDREVEQSAARIERAVTGFIEQARETIRNDPRRREKPANLLEALIIARDEPDSGFTDAHIVGNAVTMVFAGEDTTSNTIAWLVDFLARHPDVAERVAQEAERVFPHGRVLTDFAALGDFPYTDAVITEAMRLKPVAPFISLETNREVELDGVRVPAGTLILPLLRYIGQDPDEFIEPSAFCPERWMDARQPVERNASGRLFPFGGGARFCPGRYLAMAEIRMVVSMLAKNFDLTLQSAAPVKELFSFTMTPSALPVSLSLKSAARAANRSTIP